MVKPPPGFGNELELTASRPLDVYLDSTGRRLRLDTRLADGRNFFLWMSARDFEQSLDVLMHSARSLGIPWPKEPPAPT